MAYVGITDKLISSVKHSIRLMRGSEFTALEKPEFTFPVEALDVVEKYIWGEHYDLKDKIPEEWCRGGGIEGARITTQSCSFDCKLPRKPKAPPVLRSGMSDRFDRVRSGSTIFVSLSDPNLALDQEQFEPVTTYLSLVSEITTRWNKVESDIASYLQGSKSLNEAIKLWPQVAVYIPKDYLDKVAVKAERSPTASRAAELLASIDVDTAVMSAVTARMVQQSA